MRRDDLDQRHRALAVTLSVDKQTPCCCPVLAVERSLAWVAQASRLIQDGERLPEKVAKLHLIAFAYLMAQRLVLAIARSH